MAVEGENQLWLFTGDCIKRLQSEKNTVVHFLVTEIVKESFAKVGWRIRVWLKKKVRMGNSEQSFCKRSNGLVLCLRDSPLVCFRMSKRQSPMES